MSHSTPGKKRGLRLLFVHQNFPSPYWNIARYYAADPENQVAAVGEAANLRRNPQVPGLAMFGYETPPPGGNTGHPLAWGYEAQAQRGLAALEVFKSLRAHGFIPDVILLNPDWGEGLFLRRVYPEVPLLAYAELYYDGQSDFFGFDPEFPDSEIDRLRVQCSNPAARIAFAEAAHLQTPTHYQLGMFPPCFRERSSLLHEGVDTGECLPLEQLPDYQSGAGLRLEIGPTDAFAWAENAPLPAFVPRRTTNLAFTPEDEVITYISRYLEPYRGWHQFIRALALIQKRRPKAHCLVVGRTGAPGEPGYGPAPPRDGAWSNWRDVFLDKLKDELDFTRLHFLGNVGLAVIPRLMALSRAHVFLTYPFTVSRSPLEAMSCALPIVGSDTEPVRELITHGQTGLLADFFSPAAIADAVCQLLEDRPLARRLGQAARQHVIEHYDMQRVCLPRWDAVIRALAEGAPPPLFR